MKENYIHVFTFALVFLLGCGETTPKKTTIMPPVTVTEDIAVTKPPKPKPPKVQSIQRVQSIQNNRKCRMDEQEDGTIQVVSDEKDWFLYVSNTAQVECSNFGGKVKVTDGALTMKMAALVPREGGTGNIEFELREQATRFIKTELTEKYGKTKAAITFKKTPVGRSKRPALCVDADLDMNGIAGKIVACVTSKTNTNDEVVVHRAYWVGTVDEYDEKQTNAQVKNAAAAWFLYSDTDMSGKILYKW